MTTLPTALGAFRGGRQIGYVAPVVVPGLRGPGSAAYLPEWAHSVADVPRRCDVWAHLHSAAARDWTPRGPAVRCATLPGAVETAR
jgi:hypothetical protein